MERTELTILKVEKSLFHIVQFENGNSGVGIEELHALFQTLSIKVKSYRSDRFKTVHISLRKCKNQK